MNLLKKTHYFYFTMEKEVKFSLVFRDMWQSAGNMCLA